jgi:hypothetical protein
LLAHDFFRILNEPVLSNMTPDFPFAVAAKGQWVFGFCGQHGGRINIRQNLGELSAALSGLENFVDG